MDGVESDAREEEEALPVEVAVIWIRKAKFGSVKWVSSCSKSQVWWYNIRHRLRYVTKLCNYLFLLTAFFETPAYFTDLQHMQVNVEDLELFGLPILSAVTTAIMDIFLMFVLFLYYVMRWKSLGKAHRLGIWQILGLLALTLAFVDSVIVVFFYRGGLVPGSFRMSRFCRPVLFMSTSSQFRQTMNQVLWSSMKFASVIWYLALSVFVFTWIGIVVFSQTGLGGKTGNGFQSWPNSLGTVWVTMTTVNYPDVMLPGYTDNRFCFAFFFIYLVWSVYFLQNLLLAKVYDAYKEQLTLSVNQKQARRAEATDEAFMLLAVNGAIPVQMWLLFFKYYRDPLKKHTLEEVMEDSDNVNRSAHFLRAVGVDQQQSLSRTDFHNVVHVFCDTQFVRVRPPLVFSIVDNVVDCALVADLIITFAQTLYFIQSSDGRFNQITLSPHKAWFWVLFGFTVFFSVEVVHRIRAKGFVYFWRAKFQNRYDFFTVLGLLIISLIFLFKPKSTLLGRLLILVRILRYQRILVHIRPFRNLAKLVFKIVPSYWNLSLLLCYVYYVFTTFGVQFFGGKINSQNPVLKDSPFVQNAYLTLNFNDFGSGFVTLFCLMVVNNWNVVANGYLLIMGDAACLFFVSFFVVVNLVSLNILVALIIDCSTTLSSANDTNEPSDSLLRTPNTSLAGRSLEESSNPRQKLKIRNYSQRMLLHRVLTEDDEETSGGDGRMQILRRASRHVLSNRPARSVSEPTFEDDWPSELDTADTETADP